MVMPLAGRVAAAVADGLLVLAAVSSVTVTLIVSRPAKNRLTRWVDRMVDWAYEQVAVRVGDYRRRDQLRATQAAAVLLAQLAAWLIVAYVGFALLLWPFATRGVASAFVDAGSSLFTLGFAVPAGTAPAVIVFLAAATGLVILTLQIAYLPTLYAAFNRRETQVVLLSERAGVPSWGPELLARTHYALGTGVSNPGYDARSVRAVGKLGRRRGREPHQLPGAGPVPLAGTAVVLGDRAAGGAGFRRAVPGPVS
jgi:hypothetical protein